MSTSLTDVLWFTERQLLEFKAESDEIHSVYSQNSNFLNWNFVSNSLSLDIKNKTLLSKGVLDIQVADAYIIPENEQLYIKEDFQIQPLKNSVLVLNSN